MAHNFRRLFPVLRLIMNSIAQQQNTDRQISLLAAQRTLYSRAKTVAAIQILLTIPLASMWSLLASVYPSLRVWATLWGISISLIDASFLEWLQNKWKAQAAKIKEQFDCDVLQLPWNESRVGQRPEPELIAAASRDVKDLAVLRDWYSPSVSKIPLHAARIICQRSSLWWDKQLRHNYRIGIIVVIVTLFAASFFTSVYTHLTLEKFVLAVFAPLSPMLLWVIKEFRKQSAAVVSLERTQIHAEQIWRLLCGGKLTEEESLREARTIQDELYDRRKNNPLIFDWVYRLARSRQDLSMNTASEEFVRQFQQAQGS
jgi:hypothetical protein